MAWFRVDDHLYSHPKWLALPKGAKRRKLEDIQDSAVSIYREAGRG